VQAAVRAERGDVVGPLTNPYLLRFYFGYIGMPEAEFLRKIREQSAPTGETAHG
jgi:hypothetical protein